MTIRKTKRQEWIDMAILFIHGNFMVLKNDYGSYFLAENITREIYFMDESRLIDRIKGIFYMQKRIELSGDAIKSALSIIKGLRCYTVEHLLFNRIINIGDHLLLHCDNYFFIDIASLKIVEHPDFAFYKSSSFKPITYINETRVQVQDKIALNPYEVIEDVKKHQREKYGDYAPYTYSQPTISYRYEEDLQLYQEHFQKNMYPYQQYKPISDPNQVEKIPKPTEKNRLSFALSTLGFNIKYELLIIAWLVNALMPSKNMMALQITGEKSTGKTTLQNFLRNLVDPSAINFSEIPKNVKALHAILLDGYIMSFDNVESLNKSVQIEISKMLSSGIAFSRSESSVFLTKKPLLINSKKPVITEPDLLKSTLTIELHKLDYPKSDTEKMLHDTEMTLILNTDFRELFKEAFCELLHLTHFVFKNLGSNGTKFFDTSPRCNDYYNIGYWVAKYFFDDSDVFKETIEKYHADLQKQSIQDHPVAIAIYNWAKAHPGMTVQLSVGKWLETLTTHRPPNVSDDAWPHNAKKMGQDLSTVAPLLDGEVVQLTYKGREDGMNYAWEFKSLYTETPQT